MSFLFSYIYSNLKYKASRKLLGVRLFFFSFRRGHFIRWIDTFPEDLSRSIWMIAGYMEFEANIAIRMTRWLDISWQEDACQAFLPLLYKQSSQPVRFARIWMRVQVCIFYLYHTTRVMPIVTRLFTFINSLTMPLVESISTIFQE